MTGRKPASRRAGRQAGGQAGEQAGEQPTSRPTDHARRPSGCQATVHAPGIRRQAGSTHTRTQRDTGTGLCRLGGRQGEKEENERLLLLLVLVVVVVVMALQAGGRGARGYM